MKKSLIKFYILSALLLITSSIYADYLILNDGSIIKGKIESSDQASVIIIKASKNQKQTVQMRNIQMIITKPLYLEKLTVYKTDRSTVSGYCVDYDESVYTIRKKINRPEKLRILKKDILYSDSKLNPENVASSTADDSIKLKWTSPVEAVKSYRIYFKTKNETDYGLSGETDKMEYLIAGLEGSTKYDIMITSVTTDGFESLPGKPIEISTTNRPSFKPGCVFMKETSLIDDSITATWRQSSDGQVKGYNIYHKTNDDYIKSENTDKTEYITGIKGTQTKQSFFIKAFDNKSLESPGTFSEPYSIDYIEIKCKAGYLFSSGDFSDLFDSGLAGLISISTDNYYQHGPSVGAETGFYYFNNGKNYKNFSYNRFYAVPLMIDLGYSYTFYDNFFIEPSLASGYSFVGIEYKDENGSVSSIEFTPVVKAGFSLSHIIDNMDMGCVISYILIIEKNTQAGFTMLELNAGYMF